MTNNYKDLDSDNNAIDYMSKLEELNEEYSLVIAKKISLSMIYLRSIRRSAFRRRHSTVALG